MPTLTFTTGNDSYDVTAAGTFNLTFLAGNDTLTIRHAGATTTAAMGDGADVVIHRTGTANVNGDAGADRFEIYASGLTANGGADNDLFNLRGGSGQSLNGGIGNDRFNFAGAVASVLIHGGDGDDNFNGYNLAVTGNVHGDGGTDLFTGFRAGSSLYGGLGDDAYRVNPGSSASFVELASQGYDLVQLLRGADYTLPANIERIVVGTYAGSDISSAHITLNLLDNAFTGHGNDETVEGLGGNDRMFGKAGNDTLNGDDGNDLVDGGGGNDTLRGGSGNDQLVGRDGDDAMEGGTGNDTYYVDSLGDAVLEGGGEGTDTVRVSISDYVLADNFENGTVSVLAGLTLTGNALDNALGGSNGDDVLQGLDGADRLSGGAGDDTLFGANGDDTLNGGTGDDIMLGDTGNDVLRGGSGNDIYYVDNLADMVDETGGDDADEVWESLESFTLNADIEIGRITLATSATLTGNSAANGLYGNDGADILEGLGGDDSLFGGFGYDALYGGDGADVLTGFVGADSLFGGSGADIFDFDGISASTMSIYDAIQDFLSGTDKIDLSGIDANLGLAGDQAFTYSVFSTGAAAQLWWVPAGGGVYSVYADIDGGGADMRIDVVTSGLASTDFNL